MADLTHDTEDGFHEIQLSGKQLVFLFMASTVILAVTFLSGVLVGRGVPADAAADSSVVETAPEAIPSDGGAPPGEPPTPIVDDLNYQEQLTGEKDPQTKPMDEAKPAPPSTAVAETSARQAAPPPVQETKAAPKEETAPDVPTSGRAGTWFLQVSALGNRSAAAEMVRGLIAKGYPAYLQEPKRGETVLYRVRVGRYRDRSEADKVAARMKEDQFSPLISRN